MTDAFTALTQLLTPSVLIYMMVGVLVGFVIGVLPGLSGTMAIAILTPVTFWLDPADGFGMLIGVWNSAIFAGGVSAILINTPGTPASFMQTLDGYALYKQGRGGLALGVNVIYSAFGGILSILALSVFAFPIARFAIKFGPTEYFMLAVFGLGMMITIAGENLLKGVVMGVAGMLLATIGLDPMLGTKRFTLGQPQLLNGISYIAVMIGMFGIAEVLYQIYTKRHTIDRQEEQKKDEILKIGRVLPNWKEVKQLARPTLISSAIAIVVGAIPAAGGDVATIIAWGQGRKTSKHPEEYGRGSLEGLAIASCANNGVIGGALTTMLTLGVPGDTISAILIGALTMYGMTPGVKMFTENVGFIYKIIWLSLFANIAFLIFGLLTAKLTARVLKIKSEIVWVLVCVFCVVGSFAIKNSYMDVLTMFAAAVIGFFCKKYSFPLAPFILGMILSSMAESNFRRALILSHGSFSIFFTRPVTVVLMALVLFIFVRPMALKFLKKSRAEKRPGN